MGVPDVYDAINLYGIYRVFCLKGQKEVPGTWDGMHDSINKIREAMSKGYNDRWRFRNSTSRKRVFFSPFHAEAYGRSKTSTYVSATSTPAHLCVYLDI